MIVTYNAINKKLNKKHDKIIYHLFYHSPKIKYHHDNLQKNHSNMIFNE